jgi:F-type H+-transporting ATPase subunit beta
VAIDGNGGDGLLHTTVMSGWPEATRLLLRRGADPSRPGGLRQTPLHRAVMRGEPELVEMLLEAGAELDSEDHRGRTPADWCVLKGRSALLEILTGRGARPSRVTSARPAGKASRRESRRVPTGDDALGRHLDAAGLPLDDGPAPVARTGVSAAADPARTPILETGIKIVDLFAPFPRGGHVGVRGGPGMGGLLLIEQISRNVVAEHGGRVVYAGYERGAPAREHLEWRSFVADGKLLSESSVHLLAAAGDHGRYRQTVESAVTVADRWRQDGHEVLLVVESLLTRADGVLPCLRGFPSVTADAAVTTLYKGSAALGVDDAGLFDALDAVISLDVRRADRARFPAVDPGASRSRLLDESLLPEEHRQLVGSVRDHIRYFYTHNLHAVFHDGRLQEAMLHTDDVEAAQRLIRRTNRLDLFLTQPYHGTEIWTGEPDETVSLAAALDGCRRILDGDFEDVRDDAFNMIGTVEQAPEKAERL